MPSIALLGLVVQTLTARLLLLSLLPGPTGYDVYYYAVQTRSLLEEHRLWWHDRSLIYPILAAIARITSVFGALDLVAAASGALLLIPVYLLSRALCRDAVLAFTAAALCAASTVNLFFSLEFLKSALALVPFAFFLHALCRSVANPRPRGAIQVGAWALIAAAIHWSMAPLAIVAAGPAIMTALVRQRRFVWAVVPITITSLLAIGVIEGPSLGRATHLLTANLALGSCLALRCVADGPAVVLGPAWLAEVFAYYVVTIVGTVVVAFGIAGRGPVGRRRTDLLIAASLVAVELVIVGPFWRCEWGGIFFRLLRLGLVPSIALGILLITRSGRRVSHFASILVATAAVVAVARQPLLAHEYALTHPDYESGRSAMTRLASLVPTNAIVVAPHGWQFFVTWTTRRRAQTQRPPNSMGPVFVLDIDAAMPPPEVVAPRCLPTAGSIQLAPGFRLCPGLG